MTQVLLTYKEAAQYLNVSLMTIRRIVDQGKLKVVYITQRNPRIPHTEIERIIGNKIA